MTSTILLPSLTMRLGVSTFRHYRKLLTRTTAAKGFSQVHLACSSWPPRHTDSSRCLSTHDAMKEALPVELYPYQLEAAESCMKALQNGRHRIAVSLPTASGKTAIYAALITFLHNEKPVDGHILVVLPNIDLARQTYNFIKRNLPDYSVGIEQGDVQASGHDDITVATFHSLRQDTRLEKYSSRQIKGIIIDEAHHAAASSYRKILSRLTAFPLAKAHIPVIGFSATLGCRADGQALSDIFNEIIYHKDVSALIDSGHLTPAIYTNVRTGRNFSALEVSRTTFDFVEDSVAAIVNTPAFHEIVVQTYHSKCKDRKSTVVYTLNYRHTRNLMSAFRQAGISAKSLTGYTTVEERTQMLADFAEGKFSVLIGSLLLVESANMPSVDCILLARPTRSRIAFAQMVGRGALLHPGKTDYRIIDFCDNRNHNGGFNVLSTLSGLQQATYDSPRLQTILQNRNKSFDSAILHDLDLSEDVFPIAGVGSGGKVRFEEEAAPFHALDGEDPFSQDSPAGRKARRMSRYAWVCCGTNQYVLPISKEDRISISLEDGTFDIKWEGRVTSFLFFSQKEVVALGSASDLHAAFEAADVILEENMTRSELARLQRFAPWRSRILVTEGLEKLKREMNSHSGLDLQTRCENLTAGQASAMLAVLKQAA